MEALKLVARASDGKLSIPVPEVFNGKNLEVIVLLQPEETDINDESLSDLHTKRMKIFGKAKFPDFPLTKYDVYNQ